MTGHVKILGTLHIVFGALGVLFGILVLLFFGGIAGLVGLTDQSDGKLIAIPILGAIGGLVFLFALCLSLPGIIAGVGLLQFRSWARIVTIILSVFHLLNVPLGTALGFYGLWVLFSKDGERLFVGPPGQASRA